MEWQQKLLRSSKRFGWRFAICLIILSIGYIGLFGVPRRLHRPTQSLSTKISILRQQLDQTYLAAGYLSSFNKNNAVSSSELNQLDSQFRTSTDSLQAAYKQISGQLTPDIRKSVQTVIGDNQRAQIRFTDRYNVLSHAAGYDAQTDLGGLSVTGDSDRLLGRVLAAQTGLTKAANSSATPSGGLNLHDEANGTVITDATKQGLNDEAACFGKLAAQLRQHQTSEAETARADCVGAYPAVRQQVLQNIVQGAFPDSYQANQKSLVPPLLKQLDRLAKTTKE